MDAAVNQMISSGVFVSAAAGNRQSRCLQLFPGGAPAAFTAAASDSADKKASFSNYGPCVDAYAPGVHIASDWIGGGTNTISGTSMAAPAVAGTAALYLSDHASTPAATGTWLVENATTGVIQNNPSGTANLLLYKSGL